MNHSRDAARGRLLLRGLVVTCALYAASGITRADTLNTPIDVGRLTKALSDGAVFILGQEDLGIDRLTSDATQPWGRGGQLGAVQKLSTQLGAHLYSHPQSDDIIVVALGKGQLMLYRESPGATDSTPASFAAWHAHFLAALKAAGMTKDFGLETAKCLPLAEVDLRTWFRGRK